MRKIPFQVLIFVVVVIVSIAQISTGGSGSNQTPRDTLTSKYVPPLVLRGNQPIFIRVLKNDRLCVTAFREHRPGVKPMAADMSRQSYNNIARQIDPRVLKEQGLPLSL
jgi:hypothetical protein